MSAVAKKRMTVDEFLAWSQAQGGRWELQDGEPLAMSPERVAHLETKFTVATALKAGIDRAQAPCRAVPDGATVRIAASTAFEPDALVYFGPRLPRDAVEIPNPVIVVEVLSPGTAVRDHGAKLEGYFSPSSVIHYLVLDADSRKTIRHKRGQGDVIETRIVRDGVLRLDPPGLDVPVADMFAPL